MNFKERIQQFFKPIALPSGITMQEPADMIDYFLKEEERKIINLVPAEKLLKYANERASAAEASYIDYTPPERILKVTVNGYPAEKIFDISLPSYSDPNSLLYRTLRDPIYRDFKGKIEVYPRGTIVYNGIPYGNITGETLSYNIDIVEEPIIYGAAIKYGLQFAFYIANDLEMSVVKPTPPTLENYTWSFTEVLPTYSFVLPSGDYAANFTNAKTYIEADEELEKAESDLVLQKTRLEDTQLKLSESLNEFNSKLANYKSALEAEISKHRTISDSDAIKIQKYTAEVQAYASSVNESVSKKQIYIESFYKIISLLIERYKESLTLLLGAK